MIGKRENIKILTLPNRLQKCSESEKEADKQTKREKSPTNESKVIRVFSHSALSDELFHRQCILSKQNSLHWFHLHI